MYVDRIIYKLDTLKNVCSSFQTTVILNSAQSGDCPIYKEMALQSTPIIVRLATAYEVIGPYQCEFRPCNRTIVYM